MISQELIIAFADLKKDLDFWTERLNGEIRVFEADLHKLDLGLPTTIKTSPNLFLSYKRWEGKWQLTIKDEALIPHQEWPLLDAPRSLRLHAYKKFPELLLHIKNHGEEFVKKVSSAIQLTGEKLANTSDS